MSLLIRFAANVGFCVGVSLIVASIVNAIADVSSVNSSGLFWQGYAITFASLVVMLIQFLNEP